MAASWIIWYIQSLSVAAVSLLYLCSGIVSLAMCLLFVFIAYMKLVSSLSIIDKKAPEMIIRTCIYDNRFLLRYVLNHIRIISFASVKVFFL